MELSKRSSKEDIKNSEINQEEIDKMLFSLDEKKSLKKSGNIKLNVKFKSSLDEFFIQKEMEIIKPEEKQKTVIREIDKNTGNKKNKLW